MSATVHALFPAEVAIQYVRRSSDKQEDSLEQQRDLNAVYIEGKGYGRPADPGHAVWMETGSGRTFDQRLVFQAMLRALETGQLRAQVLVMYRPSRFGRTEDLSEFHYYEHRLKLAGVRIDYAQGQEYNTGGLAGHLVRTMAYAQAGEYSKDLSNYSTRGLIANARAGYSTGGEPCYGYERVLVTRDGEERGRLPPGSRNADTANLKVKYVLGDPALVAFVREHVFDRPHRMGWLEAKTARELNALMRRGEGMPPSRAGRVIKRRDGREVNYSGWWKPTTIREMWLRTTFIGWRTLVVEADNEFHGTKVTCKGAHAPLVSEEVFWSLFERTKGRPWNERKLGTPKRRKKPWLYPLSGLGTCIHCSQGMAGSTTHNKVKGHRQWYYRDAGETNGICDAPTWSIPIKDFDAWVIDRITGRLRSDAFQGRLLELLRERLGTDEGADPTASARRKLAEVEQGIERLLDMAMNMASPPAALSSRIQQLETQRKELAAQVATAPTGQRPKVRDADLQRLVDYVNAQATALLACKDVYDLPDEERQAHGELLAELAPRFIKEYRVDKVQRRIEVDFYSVPGLQPLPEPGTRIERVEAAAVCPA